MTGCLLDANVISELRRHKPDAKVVSLIATQPIDLLFVSTIALAEIRFGIEMVANPAFQAEIERLADPSCPTDV